MSLTAQSVPKCLVHSKSRDVHLYVQTLAVCQGRSLFAGGRERELGKAPTDLGLSPLRACAAGPSACPGPGFGQAQVLFEKELQRAEAVAQPVVDRKHLERSLSRRKGDYITQSATMHVLTGLTRKGLRMTVPRASGRQTHGDARGTP